MIKWMPVLALWIATTPVQALEFKAAELSLSAYAIDPINRYTMDANRDCENPVNDNDYCSGFKPGFSGYAGLEYSFADTHILKFDLIYDYHKETALNRSTDLSSDEEPAEFGSLGVHYINTNPAEFDWGVFAGFARAFQSQSEGQGIGRQPDTVFGGAELLLKDWMIQAGYMQFVETRGLNDTTSPQSENEQDGMENLFFAKVAVQKDLWNGRFEGGLMLARGDANIRPYVADPDPTYDWGQLSVGYSAPFQNSNLSWFAAAEFDYLNVMEEFADGMEQAVLTTLKLGIEIPLRGKSHRFRTPNFARVMTNAAEMN
ncbi:MAG: hypothetical protein AAGJ34_04815 [Pseudomonadota bacterium]